MITETIKVYDSRGFHYEVLVKHYPENSISTAEYDNRIIRCVTNSRLSEPLNDNDRDWEIYCECLEHWKEVAIADLLPACEEHFNCQY